jgi:hypothetical protein
VISATVRDSHTNGEPQQLCQPVRRNYFAQPPRRLRPGTRLPEGGGRGGRSVLDAALKVGCRDLRGVLAATGEAAVALLNP